MIQLGAVLAVMWLYRAKHLARGLAACPPTPTRGASPLAVLVAFVPAAIAGVLFADFVKTRLYDTGSGSPALGVIAAAFIVGGIVMLLVERLRPAPDVRDADRHAARRAPSASGSAQAVAVDSRACRARAPRSSAAC